MQVNINFLCGGMVSIVIISSFGNEIVNSTTSKARVSDSKLEELFASSNSLGAKAICAAEGNCENGMKTWRYVGHNDPANGKLNRGWCSDQGRAKGNLDSADQGCLEYVNERVPKLIEAFQSKGIEVEPETFINAIDLWNQASPRVSDSYPGKYAEALKKGMEPKEAIDYARVEAFRLNGKLDAGGLFRICRREGRYLQYPLMSEAWRRKCIGEDQKRRAIAIASVVKAGQ
ncbi:hypothetical protein [aff. Roholtiella sp. LEGE 12411]|uniref:hypothetical protein n=2 Tax=aff. Roholtiella sp. LEGE 12411 TaxID=1828822 RepID=UPI00187F2B7C|nr:hypothetical protein [aff. Roholtiella sp. LEGE 12411]